MSNEAKSVLNYAVSPEVEKMRQLEEALAKLQAENQALKKKKERPLRLKVSDKGCVSILGMNKWGIHLYPNQLARLFAARAEVEAFIEQHKGELEAKQRASGETDTAE
jgi:hypothetical protein